jgi:hypothetical protein
VHGCQGRSLEQVSEVFSKLGPDVRIECSCKVCERVTVRRLSAFKPARESSHAHGKEGAHV